MKCYDRKDNLIRDEERLMSWNRFEEQYGPKYD